MRVGGVHLGPGDGTFATGRSVQHSYAAGSWRPTLTSDAGPEKVGPVTSVSLAVAMPRRVRYAQYIALRATVVPRIPVTYGGRRFQHGLLRVRVLGPGPFVARAYGVTATASTLVVPRLAVSTRGPALVGASVRVVATLHPASAGTVLAPRSVDTRTAHVARVQVRTRAAPGWAAISQTTCGRRRAAAPRAWEPRRERAGTRGPPRRASLRGARGRRVRRRRHRRAAAFEKLTGLPRSGIADDALWRRLLLARAPTARFPGDHVEIDKTRQLLYVVRDGKVALIVPTSTGVTGNTPVGVWHVYRKVAGYDWVLYYPSYFLRGFAVHGYPDVPPYPASHGCARIPLWIAQTVYAAMPPGSTVYIY